MKKILLILLAIFMFGCLNENTGDGEKENLEKENITEEVKSSKGIIVGLKPEFKINKTQDESLEELKEIINNYALNNNIKRSGGMEFKRVHSTNNIIKRYVDSNPQKRGLSKKVLENFAYEEISDPLEKSLYREYKIELPSEINIDELILDIKENNKDIEYIQKDNLNKLNKTTNDDYFTTNPRDTRKLWGVPATETEKTWDITEGEDIIVAVVDSGVDYNHSDLKNNMWSGIGYDFSDNDNNPMDDGRNPGHGTHVAGTIAAEGNNNQGVVGIAPRAKIMALKIFPNAYDSVCANAIRYAVDNGARVLNNSWGPTQRSSSNPTVERAIDYAHSKGAVIVFAAGNSNDNADYYSGGNYSKTISVGALDSNLRRASFSNYGSTVDISAPGVNIISTWPNGRYNSIQGTSMAAPHVTGAAALLLSKYPNLTNEQVREALKSGAQNINTDRYVGGMLNTLNLIEGIVPEDPNPEDPFEPSPVINKVSKIEIGNQFEILGEEFGENNGEVWLLPAGQTERGYKLEIQNWSESKIISSVGDNIPAGDYTVIIKIATGELSNYFEVEVLDIETEIPVINEVTSEIFEGDNFKITGSNFGNSGRVMAISQTKGTIELSTESWSNTNITVSNDLDPGNYSILVQNENGNNSNEINIEIKEIEVEIPTISEIKQPLYENENIEVTGENFGNSGKLYIWINGGAVPINTIEWSSSKVIGQKDLVKGEYYALIQNGTSKEYSEWIKFEVKEQIKEETDREYLLNNHDLFDNGGVYNWSQSGSYGDDKIRGTAGDDSIRGVAGNNTIYSGLGRDTIYGGYENDTYLYIAGDGYKKIIDNGGTDKIIFFNVDQNEINYSRSGYDLLISSSKNNVDITIKYYYYNSNYKIEYVDFK